MTKEPKLDAAVRIVPEWKDFDNEIKSLMQKWQQEEKAKQTNATQSSTTTTTKHKEPSHEDL